MSLESYGLSMHGDGGMYFTATFSDDRVYRYDLLRRMRDGSIVAFIGLNPSTADERHDDPTVAKCRRYAAQWGYNGIVMLNIFAFRATEPKDMKGATDPIGPENDKYILKWINEADLVIGCWGTHGKHRDRESQVLELVPEMKCLGMTKRGHPQHPLYMRENIDPMDFDRRLRNGEKGQ